MVFYPWRTLTAALTGVILGFGGFYLYQVNTALSVVAAEDFDPVRARTALEARPNQTTTLVPEDQRFYDLEAELAMITERLRVTTFFPSSRSATTWRSSTRCRTGARIWILEPCARWVHQGGH